MIKKIKQFKTGIDLWLMKRQYDKGKRLPYYYPAYAFVNYLVENTEYENDTIFKKNLIIVYVHLINKIPDKELIESVLEEQFKNNELGVLSHGFDK